MRRILMVAAVALAGCSGTGTGNGGATGAAPERYMGVRPNVNATYDGSTASTSMLKQRIKEDSARGATSGGGNTRY